MSYVNHSIRKSLPDGLSLQAYAAWELYLPLDMFLSGFQFDTEDSEILIPGFLDSIIGIRAGETKSFPLVFPESWRQEDLRGVHAQFTVSAFLFHCNILSCKTLCFRK